MTKFGTYFRDAIGQDYAEQRYYNAGMGRFWSPDRLAGYMANPGSLNRYAYTHGDPINRYDPSGFATVGPWNSPCPPDDPCPGGDDDGGGSPASDGMQVINDPDSEGGGGGEDCSQAINYSNWVGTDAWVMGLTSFFEYQAGGSHADAGSVWAAIDWVFENRYGLSPSAAAQFYGSAGKPSTLQGVITGGSDVWQPTFQYTGTLNAILNGPDDSEQCYGLYDSLLVASAVIGGLLPDPVPGALYFASGGAKPGHGPGVTLVTVGQYGPFTFFKPIYPLPHRRP